MDFILRYRGALPAKKQNNTKDKNEIRFGHFHPQLHRLCQAEPRLAGASRREGLKVPANIYPPPTPVVPVRGVWFRFPVGGFDFLPLVQRAQLASCRLEILWLREERAGDIVSGGDLDNRLKTLLDSLTMPRHPEQLKGAPPPTAQNALCYCLLEDDSLITKLSVETFQTLEAPPPPVEGHAAPVDLVIHVTMETTYPAWGSRGVA